MTLEGAKATAIGMTTRFGADFAVFRLRGWHADEWGVLDVTKVPHEAEIADVFRYTSETAPEPRAHAQGDLFG